MARLLCFRVALVGDNGCAVVEIAEESVDSRCDGSTERRTGAGDVCKDIFEPSLECNALFAAFPGV